LEVDVFLASGSVDKHAQLFLKLCFASEDAWTDASENLIISDTVHQMDHAARMNTSMKKGRWKALNLYQEGHVFGSSVKDSDPISR
jgi:hypothetical protein